MRPNTDVCLGTKDVENNAKEWIEVVVRKKVIKSIPWSEFQSDSIKEIGEGGFGSVFKAYWTDIHSYVACKKFRDLTDIHYKMLEAFKHELHMQIRAHDCENIIRILGISKSKFKFTFYTIDGLK